MKNKITSLIVLLVLICSLIPVALTVTPASAGTLSWSPTSPEAIPTTTDKVIETSIVNDFAVASDGKTIYAVLTNNKLYKSTNAGVQWTSLTSPATNTTDNTSDMVAITPGNDNIVVVIGTNSGAKHVWISINAGSSFTDLGQPTNAAGTAMTVVNDIAISPAVAGVNNVAVAGGLGGAASICYFNYGALITNWVDAASNAAGDWTDNISGSASVAAIAFSPSFATDKIITALTRDASNNVLFNAGSFSTKRWNTNISGFTGYPVLVTNGPTALTGDIALASNYIGADAGTRIAFIGTMETAGVNAPGALYRLDDNQVTLMKKGVGAQGIKSVAYNTAATVLVAGEKGSNTVWRCTNPLATSQTVTNTGSTYKKPGIDYKSTNVNVKFAGTTVFATTSGTDGGFSVSSNNGTTFNDISLVNTAMTSITDFSTNGTTNYIVSNDGTDASLWRYTTAWQRVRAWTPTNVNCIIRLAPEDASVAYIAEIGTPIIWQTTDGGQTKWSLRYTSVGAAFINIQDMAVESILVVYVAEQGTKNVSKSVDGGFNWSTTALDTKLAGGNSYMITSVANDQLLVSSTTGYVSYTVDGGTTWTGITYQTESTATNIEVTADKTTSGGYVYAVGGPAGAKVLRWKIDPATTSWTKIIAGTVNGMATGIGLSGGILYIIANSAGTSNITYLYRQLDPMKATDSSPTVWTTVSTSSALFADTPQALKISSGPKLWAVNSKATPDTLLSFDDTAALAGPALDLPVEGFADPVNTVTGFGYDVIYQWPRLSKSAAYEMQLAYDTNFTQVVATFAITSDQDPVVVTLGPTAAYPLTGGGTLAPQYQPGTTYYWRVRANAPLYSPWSEVRSFTIQSLAFLRGDVNGDGKVNSLDITAVERVIAGLEP